MHQTRQIQIQHGGAAAFDHAWMKFEQTADVGLAVQNSASAAGMLVGLRGLGRAHRDSGQQAFGQTLELEQAGRAIVFAKKRRGEMRHLAIGMNRAADFEQPELIEVARVIVDVLPDARQQAGAQQILIRRDGVRDLHVRGQIERKTRAPFPR